MHAKTKTSQQTQGGLTTIWGGGAEDLGGIGSRFGASRGSDISYRIDGKYAHRKTWKGGHRRKNPPEAIKRFEVLVMAVIALEIVALLWITGALGGPL